MQKNFVLILITFYLYSCSFTKQVSGLYGKCVNNSYTCTQVKINSNHTFEYYTYQNGGSIIIKGKWNEVTTNTIALNSDSQPKNPITKYYARTNPELKNTIRIRLLEASRFLSHAVVNINNGEQIKTANEKGEVEFSATKIYSIKYQFLGLSETITITNPSFNEIEIVAKDYETTVYPKYFTNKIVTKKFRKIVFEKDDISSKFMLNKVAISRKRW